MAGYFAMAYDENTAEKVALWLEENRDFVEQLYKRLGKDAGRETLSCILEAWRDKRLYLVTRELLRYQLKDV